MIVTLTPDEMTVALGIGTKRNVLYSTRAASKRQATDMTPEQLRWVHQKGAMGEMAVAKALNLYWSGMLAQKGVPDVGYFYEVRTKYGRERRLTIKPDDEGPIILVWGHDHPRFHLLGWCWPVERDSRHAEMIRDEAYIDAVALQPMSTLPTKGAAPKDGP